MNLAKNGPALPPGPIATYRLQLQPSFGFSQAKELIGYLAELGISHLYLSPCFQAVAGSTHGYDIVDPCKINKQLGGAPKYQELCLAAKKAGLGIIADIVPNHMAIEGQQNPWWWDVLENGPSSPFATFFDVDWDASEERWPNKVLLPVLEDHYGRVLEKGLLKLVRHEDSITLHYSNHSFPLDPSSLSLVYGKAAESAGSEMLAFLAESYARMPRPTVTARKLVERRQRDKAVLQQLVVKLCREEAGMDAAIQAEIERLNTSHDALDALLDQQNYRLAYWRTVNRDLGYRRFFDIKDLIGLKTEDSEVFRAIHSLPIAWYANQWIQGLRIDHPDGLRNPTEYFTRIEASCPGAWIVAEKILQPGELLPGNWKVAGTTGYDFLNLVNQLYVDPKGREGLTQLYREFAGNHPDFNEQLLQSKYLVITELFGSELNRLATLFTDICEKHPRYRDYTRHDLKEALCWTAVCFPVYRSYVSASEKQVSAEDEAVISTAIQSAKAARPELDADLFDFLKRLLLLRIEGVLKGELAMRFQQLTGPAMAKGLEDTALYRYHRLTALNEVGGNPACFGIAPEQFHAWCAQAQKIQPFSLLASSTHDTKRSEDVRARLALLSELPETFGKAVFHWQALNAPCWQDALPDKNAEYLFYQTLLGAWPINVERMQAFMQKAAREAKENTSWTHPNKEYESSLAQFVHSAMQNRAFFADFERFLMPLIPLGQRNTLAQTLIKLTAPGIPDLYQGCELWNLQLVDPDNRGPIDFSLREKWLREIGKLSLEDICSKMEEGFPKLWLIQKILKYRKDNLDVFPQSSYTPLYADGSKAAHLVAFMRGNKAIVLAPRLLVGLKEDWADTTIVLPEGNWKNILTGEEATGRTSLKTLFSKFPVAFLAGLCG